MADSAVTSAQQQTPASPAGSLNEPPPARPFLARLLAETRPAVAVIALSLLACVAGVALLSYHYSLAWVPVVSAVLVGSALAATVSFGLSRTKSPAASHGPKQGEVRTQATTPFGLANTVTMVRASMTVALAAFVPVAAQLQDSMLWVLTVIAILALIFDGIDGYIARKRNECSAFGARFDMEIDAVLALIICLLLWRSGESGLWVLGLGVMRYLFIAASWKITALQAPLYPSFRRKLVCVIQVGALCAMLSPLVAGYISLCTGLFALVCLAASFARDVIWLLAQR